MITMVLGTACPEGFEEVGEDGKFVRSGENRGSSTHSVTTEVGVFRNGTLDFEGYQSKSFVTTFKNSANYPLYDPNNTNDPVDVPDEKGVANHKHTIGDGDSVPVGVLLRMCQRV
jgi:predicted amidohydrolase YtcJ